MVYKNMKRVRERVPLLRCDFSALMSSSNYTKRLIINPFIFMGFDKSTNSWPQNRIHWVLLLRALDFRAPSFTVIKVAVSVK